MSGPIALGPVRTLNRARIRRDVFAIGASAGGVEALLTLFAALEPDLPAAVIAVLHRSRFHASMLLDLFADRAALPVLEPADGDLVRPGAIYLAPRDHHLLVIDEAFRLSRGARQHFTRPAIDPTFATVACSYGERAVAVVLTGSGHDGVAGAGAIHSAGGLVLTQRLAEAQHPSMPAHVVMHDHVDALLGLDELPRTIGSLAHGEAIRMRPVALRGFA